jgi:ElaB/YqjD/DUF883 family membrane-anchored ribosome-binding protein
VGEEPRTSRSEVDEGAQPDEPREPEEIRRNIEATRAELGDTVEALAEKTDVKQQAKDRIDDRRAQLKSKAGAVREKISSASPEQAQRGAGQLAEHARQQPLPYAAFGAFAAGLLVGMLIKRS